MGLPLPFGAFVPFRCIMPIGAGVAVAWLQSQGFSPSLKFLTRAIESVVDDNKTAAFPSDYGQVGHTLGVSPSGLQDRAIIIINILFCSGVTLSCPILGARAG